MKALTTAGLTKLIQLIKSNFISTSDTVTTNTVTLATVATSGSYNDLSDKPTIGNGTITFTQGGVSKGTITANQTGNSTIALDAGGGTVDQTYDGSSANAQSGVAIEGAGFLTGITSSDVTNALGYTSSDNTLSNVSSIDSSSAVATALDGKADTDLSNLSATGKTVIDGQWVGINQSIISSATSLTGSTNLTYRVDLPNDGHKYEVMLRGNIYTGNTAGNDVSLAINGNQDSTSRFVCRANGAVAGTWTARGTVICVMSYVASSEKNLTVSRAPNWAGYCNELAAIAYRRIGTNT